MKKIISITDYKDENLIVSPEGIGVYLSGDEEVLSGVGPAAPILISPGSGSVGVSLTPTLDWNAGGGAPATHYRVELSTNEGHLPDIIDTTVAAPATEYSVTSDLALNTLHYWRVSASDGGPYSESSNFIFTTLDTPPSHSVNFYAGANGSITGDTTQTIADGADSTPVTAVPDSNFHFTAWSGDNTSTDNPLTLTNVTSDMDTTANFAIDTYSVNFYAGANGTLTGDATQTIDHGSNSTAVTAVPDADFAFTAWSGDSTSTDNPLTLTNVIADLDTTANFIATYGVTFHAGANGSLTGDTTQTINEGGNSTAVTAVPDTGAAFTAWSGDNTSTDNPLTVTGVTSAMDMTANFTVNTYTVTFVVDDARHGELVGSASQTVAHGGSTTAVRADAFEGYDFSAWSGGNTSTTNPLTLTNVTANTTVQANFVREFNKGRMLSGSRGGADITFDTDSTDFSPARFGTRGRIPFRWNFPS